MFDLSNDSSCSASPFEKNKPGNWWTHSGRTWRPDIRIERTEDQAPQYQRTPSGSESAARQPTLYSIKNAPVFNFKVDLNPANAQLIDGILEETKFAKSGERLIWCEIPEGKDTSKEADPSRKKQLFERLCNQYESLVERHHRAKMHLLIERTPDQQVKKWTDKVRYIQRQIVGVDDYVLLDMQYERLKTVLLEVAQTVSRLEEDVLRENYNANKMMASLAAMNTAN
jgi:hypothetical protein